MTKNLKQRKMPNTREAITHEFVVGGVKGYVTVGLYEDGAPGELFINVSKEGSTISGLLDAFSIAVSFALQSGVPLDRFIEKFSYMKFEPSGYTGTDFGYAHSIIDYVFRWVAIHFERKQPKEVKHIDDQLPVQPQVKEVPPTNPVTAKLSAITNDTATQTEQMKSLFNIDGPPCHHCGGLMVMNGACHKCMNCGETSGCS